ncbi:MAG: hypothetical protein IPO31_08610 [Candidatus Obscuribacter sp.]|nr:hypothetical protein [Candidatus Obscuribacter sp.]
MAQPGVNNEPARVTNYDGGTVSSNPQPGYQPQQPQQPPQPQPQPGSQDVMRTASYDNSSTVNPQGTGTPTAQPPAQQYTGETVRGTSYDNTGSTPSAVHQTNTGQPNIQPGSNEQPRVTGDSTASANTTQYNSTQHVTPPVGPNQVSNSETHMRTADSGSGIISPASGGPTPVNYTTNPTVSPSAQHVTNSGGEVRIDNPTPQSQGTSWTNNSQPGQNWTQANEPERPNQNWSNQPVNREAPPAPNQHVANNNLERPAMPEQRPPERAEYRAEPSSNAYVPPLMGQTPQGPANAPTHYGDQGRVNETHAQQQRVQEQQRQVEQQQQRQRAEEQQRGTEPQRPPSGNQSRHQAPVPPQVFVQPHQQPPARPDAQRTPQQPQQQQQQQQPNPQQAKQADAGAPPEAPKSKDNPLAPNNSAKSGGPTQKSIGDVLRKMGQAPGEKKKRKPGDPPEQ